jgi:uncharacterized membrane protein (DUF485 family)
MEKYSKIYTEIAKYLSDLPEGTGMHRRELYNIFGEQQCRIALPRLVSQNIVTELEGNWIKISPKNKDFSRKAERLAVITTPINLVKFITANLIPPIALILNFNFGFLGNYIYTEIALGYFLLNWIASLIIITKDLVNDFDEDNTELYFHFWSMLILSCLCTVMFIPIEIILYLKKQISK